MNEEKRSIPTFRQWVWICTKRFLIICTFYLSLGVLGGYIAERLEAKGNWVGARIHVEECRMIMPYEAFLMKHHISDPECKSLIAANK